MDAAENLESLQEQLRKRKLEIKHLGLRVLPKDFIELKKKVDDLEKSTTQRKTALQQETMFQSEAKTENTSTQAQTTNKP